MNLLREKIVFCGLVTACRFATCPTSRSPSFVNATTEGVVRPPSAWGMPRGSPPSITATTLLVVPRSMPRVLAIALACLLRRASAGSGLLTHLRGAVAEQAVHLGMQVDEVGCRVPADHCHCSSPGLNEMDAHRVSGSANVSINCTAPQERRSTRTPLPSSSTLQRVCPCTPASRSGPPPTRRLARQTGGTRGSLALRCDA